MKIQTFLINLDSSVERREKADQQLKAHKIDYQRISAVDGRQLNIFEHPLYDSQQSWKLMGRDLLGAEIGCYLSHIKCLERFLETDADYLIVLEDDLSLDDDFLNTVKQTLTYLEQHNPSWHLINIASKKRKFSKHITTIAEKELSFAYYFPVLTLGLLWSRQGAMAFMNSQYTQSISSPIDVTLQSWLSYSGKGLCIYPPLVIANGADSDIDGANQNRARIGRYLPRQKRMWKNRYYALKHLLCPPNR